MCPHNLYIAESPPGHGVSWPSILRQQGWAGGSAIAAAHLRRAWGSDDAQVADILEGRYEDTDTANPYDLCKFVSILWG